MMNPLADKKLTLGKLKQLISSAKGLVPQDIPAVESEDYDWTRPHHFCPEHLSSFDVFAKKIEAHITSAFDTLCQGGFEVSITSYEQHLASSLASQLQTEMKDYYFLPFEVDNSHIGGFAAISPATSVSLVGYMLRDPEFDTDPERHLSSLEESILMDIVSAIIEAIEKPFAQAGGPSMETISKFIKGDWPLSRAGLDDLFSMRINISKEGHSIEMSLVIPATAMEPILGVKRPCESVSGEKLARLIMENLQRAPVEVRARLSQAMISLNDVMNLARGDVLVLKKKTYEPLDILLNERPCFKAYPAITSGKYSIILAEEDDDVYSMINS